VTVLVAFRCLQTSVYKKKELKKRQEECVILLSVYLKGRQKKCKREKEIEKQRNSESK